MLQRDSDVVFVEQTTASLMLTYFFRCVALKYLWDTYYDLVRKQMKSVAREDIQIDMRGTSMTSTEDFQSSTDIVETDIIVLAQQIVWSAIKSRKYVPIQIKRVSFCC